MSTVIDGSLGITYPDSSNQPAASSPYTLKNRIINGSMQIDQRNAGASVTLSGSAGFGVDRFAGYRSNASAVMTAQQSSTAPTGFTKSLLITTTTGATVASTDYSQLRQNIEGFNIADLGFGTANAQTITLSFWVRGSLTGTYGIAFCNGAEDRSRIASYTINAANTWEQKTITIAGDTSGTWSSINTGGLIVIWDLGFGSNYNASVTGSWVAGTYQGLTGGVKLQATTGATWYVTGVQLEQNTSATPFERRLYGQELMNCQRYYARLVSTSGNYIAFGSGYFYNTTTAAIYVKYPVAMRAAPTASVSNVRADCAAGTAPTTLGTAYYGSDSAYLNFTGGSGITTGQGSVLMGNNNANAYVDFSAEL